MYFDPEPEIKRKVIQTLNEKHGKDLLDLNKCLELYNKLLEEKKQVEKQVGISFSRN